jgi:antitoxin component of MazEF toxin-antitoxin module
MRIEVKRKLFASGDSLAVTLPKAWTRYFRLKAGDSVQVIANDEIKVTVSDKNTDKNMDFHTDLTESR